MSILLHEDPVHKTIVLRDRIIQIVNHPFFQRLKEIKQLGLASLHFKEANHTRYEHCIGTYYLAKKFMRILSENANIVIDEFHQDCVSIAGLLHDIGHGPFSHTWEKINKYFCEHYHHEEIGSNLVDIIFKEIRLFETDENHFRAIELIKAFIIGKDNELKTPIKEEYKFLFEIVNNKKCEIDVDKWDYLLRDMHYAAKHIEQNDLNLSMNFEKTFTKASVSSDNQHIVYNIECASDVYNLFDMRQTLHMNLYQYPQVRAKEILLIKAIEQAINKGFKEHFFNIMPYEEKLLTLTDTNILSKLRSLRDEDKEIDEYLFYMEQNLEEDPDEKALKVDIRIPEAGQKIRAEKISFYFPNAKTGYFKKTYFYKTK